MNYLDAVRDFHRAFEIEERETPEVVDYGLRLLRTRLLMEEVKEYLVEEITYPDLAKIAKELADVLYIAFGTAVTYGLPMDEIFAEVHRSNMSKLGEDGRPIYREDGKVLKGPNYSPADIESILRRYEP